MISLFDIAEGFVVATISSTILALFFAKCKKDNTKNLSKRTVLHIKFDNFLRELKKLEIKNEDV
jgi:hypothetical protein